MDITLLDLFRFIKRKYKAVIFLFFVGVLLNFLLYLQQIDNKRVTFVIAIDHFVWEEAIFQSVTMKNISTHVADRYLGIIETTKLGVDSEIAVESGLKPSQITNHRCNRLLATRVLQCFNDISKSQVEKFIQSSEKVVNLLIASEMENIVKNLEKKFTTQSFLSTTEMFNSNIIEANQVNLANTITDFNSLRERILADTMLTYKISNKTSKRLNMVLLLIGPIIGYLIFVLIFFPNWVRSNKEEI